jgi:hypothetical protein
VQIHISQEKTCVVKYCNSKKTLCRLYVGVASNIGKDYLCEVRDVADIHLKAPLSPLSQNELVRGVHSRHLAHRVYDEAIWL